MGHHCMLSSNKAVVTGIGVLAPNGVGKDAFWSTLVAGESGIGPITLFDASDLPCRIGGEVKGFDPHTYISPKLKPGRRMSRAAQFGVAAARLALEDAGLTVDDLRACRETPVMVGVSTSAMDLFAAPPTMYTASASVPHAVGSAIAYTLGFESKLFTISNGCASGMDAIAAARQQVENFDKDIVLAGSADAAITRYVFEGFSKSKRLSLRNDDPQHASRPFDRDRDGGVISEGAGIVVIENREHARARGATIYAELDGCGAAADSPEAMEGGGMADAMRRALADACRNPEQIDCISAHAPSDKQMDLIEVELIKEVFGDAATRVPVTSVKGVTGNAMAVGGVHEFIAAVLSLQHGVIPPTANLETLDPACNLDCVCGGARDAALSSILVNSHGFGRGNSSVVVTRPA